MCANSSGLDSSYTSIHLFRARFVVPKTSGCCGWEKRSVRVVMNEHPEDIEFSAQWIIRLIRDFSDNERQFLAILELSKIPRDATRIHVGQMEKLVSIFHDILQKQEFPILEDEYDTTLYDESSEART